ncbi:homeodomain-interacting protein kinase 2-like [Centropristis striata]|uniref:homeodomain-interacting protein kinase 2-like n=1 Tax=Centropristis striata TaxID=184440 RepID=UPI0027E041F9|nr:homeodomain-interacting protein kinase 2-like [Centropristis striata]
MMVDQRKRPFEVKLIDFGLAMHKSEAMQGMTVQVVSHRAPEIMLGLPVTEAIDIWSLGCMMASMLHGKDLTTGENEYEMVQDITALLGLPADHLLDAGLKTKRYFTMERGAWRLKTHEEYCRKHPQRQYKTGVSYCLDDFRKVRLERNRSEAMQRAQCIDLLEAMLILDPAKRITPKEILNHPFITGRQSSSSRKKKTSFRWMKRRIAPDPTAAPPRVIPVRPAAAELRLLDIDEEISEPSALSDDNNNIERHRSSPSPTVAREVVVRLALAELRLVDIDEKIR